MQILWHLSVAFQVSHTYFSPYHVTHKTFATFRATCQKQEKMRWENTSPCPMIIFFNLFLSSRHAMKNIFSFSGSSPCPRGLWSQDQWKSKKFSRRRIIEWNRNNRNLKSWSSLISQCVLSSRAQWVLEKSYFIFWKGKELKAAWTIFHYVDENFSHSFQNQIFAIHRQTWCPLPMPFSYTRTEQQSVITSLGHYNWPIRCLS